MAQLVINVGTAPNDGLGDPIRTAYQKCNTNFSELYSRWQNSPPATLVGTPGDSAGMYAYDATYFYYCFGDYDGSTVIWSQISQSSNLVNGTSNITIYNNGNIATGVAGTSNVTVTTSTGLLVNGDLSVTGNATLSGNILGDRIVNGTTELDIQVANGNANLTIGGTSNVVVWANTGEYVTGIISATGNILTAGLITATGNISGGNLRTEGLASVTGNITGGNIVTAGLITATGNISGGNLRTAGLFTATGNVTGGNLITAGLITATGNVQAGNLRTAGLISATGTITGANISGGNITTAGLISATGNVTGGNITTAGLVSATGNVTGGNIRTAGLVSATGNLTGNNISSVTTMQLAVYANTTVRDSSISSPQPGMMIYVTGTGMQVRGATSWNTVAGTGT